MTRAQSALLVFVISFFWSGWTSALTIVGSDTAATLLRAWAKDWQLQTQGASVSLQAVGSSTAPLALAQGTASLGVMSRAMSAEELSEYLRKRGQPPVAIPFARDALRVIVHPDNPIQYLERDQFDQIFSSHRLCSGKPTVRRWSQVTTDDRQQSEASRFGYRIHPVGRSGLSGSHAMVRERLLCGGSFRNDVLALTGFAAIVDVVGSSRGAIAYVGANAVNTRVRTIPIKIRTEKGEQLVSLERQFYFYLPVSIMAEANREACQFLHFVASPDASAIAKSLGFSTEESRLRSKVAEVCDDP